MVFNGFKAKLLFRLLLLVVAIVVTIFVVFRTDWYMTTFCLSLLVLFQLYDMLYFVERTNRDISSFLEAIKHSDFTQRFADAVHAAVPLPHGLPAAPPLLHQRL